MVFVFFSKSPEITREIQHYGHQEPSQPSTFISPQMLGENLTQSIFDHFLGNFNFFNNTLGHINTLLPFFERNWIPLSNNESQLFVTNLEDNKIAYVARSQREKDNISMYETFIAFVPNNDFPAAFPQLYNGSLDHQNNIRYLP